MSKLLRFLFLIFIITIISACQNSGTITDNKPEVKVRNIIIMIPDGCSQSMQTLARLYKGSDLYLDQLNAGVVRTNAASSLITDSAAATTAFATGHKTNPGILSMGPKKEGLLKGYESTVEPYYPMASVLEGAKLKGMATGIIVTNEVCDATPGGFASHTSSRRNFDDIIKQMVYQDIDLVFGGGGQHLFPKGMPTPYMDAVGGMIFGSRADSEDLSEVLNKRGYKFIMDKDELSGIHEGRIWGIFSPSKLSPEMNREEDEPSQPSLAEMTEKAIEILSKDKDGFMLVVEGSQVDWGGHANDPQYMVSEFLAFDKAVGKALEFAKKDGNTVLIAFPDHDTGGLTLGNTNRKYNSYKLYVDDIIGPFKNSKVTLYKLIEILNRDKNITEKKVMDIFSEKLGVSIDESQAKEILGMKKNFYKLADYINNNIYAVGWTTYMHSANDVPLWFYSSKPEYAPRGSIDNTEIAKKISAMIDIDLKKVTDELYVEVGTVFKDYYEFVDDSEGPVLKIGDALLYVNKDILSKGEKKYEMGGIVIHSPEINKFFIPKEAVELISPTSL